MLEFKDTKLLKHPTVERAYNVMRTFFTDGDDFAREAIRPGEIISASAKTPDPDAIAASILMNGMIVPLEAEQFETTVSPGAAKFLKKFYDLDLDNPKFSTAGEQQALLAQSMVGLERIQAKIDAGEVSHYLEFSNTQQILDANERALKSIARKTTEPDMLAAAQAQLAAAQQSLADIVAKSEKAIAFENTGLPDHPTVRKVYEEMKAWALDGDPLGGYALTNVGIARVLVDTGTSSDPEVISAALLNQYAVTGSKHKKPSAFSERIGELYDETSPWARFGSTDKEKNTPQTPEAQSIVNAANVYIAESTIKAYHDYRADPANFDEGTAVKYLQSVEKSRDKLEKAAAAEAHDGLKARMEKTVNEADALLHAPENSKHYKPAGPKPAGG